ncbi:DUF4190 domain-containing protein [Cellulomonas denverensis]|uniref:DUF4190 domain-containing protein n=1 Tax=Cellulomonas denverensis TaxID=264297 RepID=UPI0035EE8792
MLALLFGPLLLAAPVGLGLGIWSLSRIRRTGAEGKGLAITGVVLGGVGTLGLVLLALLFGFLFWAFSTGW